MGGLFGKMPNIMGKVVFEDPVHHISGKIAKKFRTIYYYKPATGLKYTSVRSDRTTPLKQKEVAIRQRFQAVRAMVAARKEDLSKVTQDQIDFMAQKDLANGKKTMNAYLWKVCGLEYDESQD